MDDPTSANGRLHALTLHLVEELAHDRPLQQLLDELTAGVPTALGFDAAGVLVIDGDALRVTSASDATLRHVAGLQISHDEGPCLQAYRGDAPVLVPDLGKDPRFPSFGPQAADHGLAAAFSFPLRHGGRRIGAAGVYRRTPGPASAGERRAGHAFARTAAAIVTDARVHESLRARTGELQHQVLHDQLTGLPNRRLLTDRIAHALAASRRSGRVLAVLFMDLDRFKVVNDTFGHRMGDRLLVAVGERLRRTIRPGDTVARVSGDEFVILCVNLHRCADATEIAARVEESLSAAFTLDGHAVEIRGSIGVACADEPDTEPSYLLDRADRAMYVVKERRYGPQTRRGPAPRSQRPDER